MHGWSRPVCSGALVTTHLCTRSSTDREWCFWRWPRVDSIHFLSSNKLLSLVPCVTLSTVLISFGLHSNIRIVITIDIQGYYACLLLNRLQWCIWPTIYPLRYGQCCFGMVIDCSTVDFKYRRDESSLCFHILMNGFKCTGVRFECFRSTGVSFVTPINIKSADFYYITCQSCPYYLLLCVVVSIPLYTSSIVFIKSFKRELWIQW